MFSFFSRKKTPARPAFNYDTISVDMHSHVLPGIDDGAQTVDESIVLVQKMIDLGIKKIIATPHIIADYYRNTPETIGNALNILKAELVARQIDIPVEAAAEHFFDETFEARVKEHRLMTMGDNYVLFELSFISKPPNLYQMIQTMRDLGYKPILAHPERYLHMDIDDFRMLHDWGCDLQLNTISLTSYFGKQSRKLAEQMIDNDLVDFISSDMHHPRHAAAFEEALKMPYLEKILFDYPLKNKMLL